MQYKVFTPQELQGRFQGNLYCFGAGKVFDTFFAGNAGKGLTQFVRAVADNHADELSVSIKVLNGRSIPVISLDSMLNDIEEGDIILITTVSFREIIAQLDSIEKLQNTMYCIYFVVEIEFHDKNGVSLSVPNSLARYDQIRIPKLIHYCWFGKEEIPARYRKWMESWKKYCPDYEIIRWSEDNYDVHKSKYMSQAYDMGQWAFVSDYARIDIINEYGGVYLDTDVEVTRNFDELLRNDAFCGFENCQLVNSGLGFGSRKQNRILTEIKEYYDSRSFQQEDGNLDKRCCPYIQTEIMEKHGLKGNGAFQIVDGMTVLPPRVLCGMSSHSFRTLRDLSCTYAIHHYTATWLTEEWRKRQQDLREWIQDNKEYSYLD